MSDVTWLVTIYLAGGVLTTLAVACIVWSERPATLNEQPGQWKQGLLIWLKVFTLWPAVVGMGIVFALIMFGQKRQ